MLFVGRDARRVREAMQCEAVPNHDRELGRLLGYPACCVDAYLDIPPPRRNVAAFACAAAASAGVFEPRLNTLDLAVFHYLPWLPCSFSCALSKRFADAVAEHVAKRHGQFLETSPHGRRELDAPGFSRRAARSACPPACRHERFVEDVDEALSAVRVLVLEDVQVSIRGALRGGEVHVERVWPTARDRHPDARLDPDAHEATARLVALVEAGEIVAVDRGVLYVGGAPALWTEDALLVPFASGARPPAPGSGT